MRTHDDSRGFTNMGVVRRAARPSPPEQRALCWHTHDRETLTQARSARAPPVAAEPRYRLEADIADRTIRRSRSSIRPFRLTAGTPHMSSARSSVAPVRYACAHRPTCLIRCSRQARPGPNGHPRVLTRVIERVAPGTSGTVERRSRSRSLPPWAQGPTPPAAPRRAARFIDTRGAFRRWVTLLERSNEACTSCLAFTRGSHPA